MKENKIYIKIIISIFIFALIAVIISFYISNKEQIKKIKNEDYVYEEEYPIINIDSGLADEINIAIKDLYESTKNDETSYINSQIFKNNNLYSLVIKNDNYSYEEETFLTSYIIYNVDIKDGQIIEKEDLLNKYGFTKDDVIASALNLLQKYYEEEASQGYVEANECDITCYISFVRGIDDIYENVKLFVENEKLKGYITFSTNSLLSDQDYFSENNNIYEFDIIHKN
ncbi:MAG: hypothetical protein PHN42_04005 [Bacilli bacterium]|nr:hypothetical protein [Bacilli bacterium]